MRFQTLPQWLKWQENLHFTEVDPGLERIAQVWKKLKGPTELPFTIISVAGTNGKGSSVALLSSILTEAGYQIGSYTSPHLLRYNERICIDKLPCDDVTICRAFDKIDQARGRVSLTYFEFATLAAMLIFCEQKIDIALLEVGMGGRLDAVNLFDADIALITPIGLDHTMWLGNDREQIGLEKAGIMRKGKPVVCSDFNLPQTIIEHAKAIASPLHQIQQDFSYKKESGTWQWHNKESELRGLAPPALLGDYQLQNAAAVLQVVSLLNKTKFSITYDDINRGLETVYLLGRFQRIEGEIEHIFDVTHNQQGANNLKQLLQALPNKGKTLAVLGMMKDKEPAMIASTLKKAIDGWYIAELDIERSMSCEALLAQLQPILGQDRVYPNGSITEAYNAAKEQAKKGDRILIFGSFITVEAIMTHHGYEGN